MYALLELYARPMSRAEPVICIDEKSLQLIGHSRAPLPMNSRSPEKVDYEYARNGTTNLFVAVEPKAGQRTVSVTERRGKADFVVFVGDLLTHTYAKARRVHLVLDNLNIHFRRCFDDVLGKRAANKLLRRVQFHYTPKHASWLNWRRSRSVRKQTVEPVFGIIKRVMGWQQMSMRGLRKAQGEWRLVTMAWNIKRMHVLRAA